MPDIGVSRGHRAVLSEDEGRQDSAEGQGSLEQNIELVFLRGG